MKNNLSSVMNGLFTVLAVSSILLASSCRNDSTEESDPVTPESELLPKTSDMRFACPVHTVEPLRSDNLEAVVTYAPSVIAGIDNVSDVFIVVEQEDFAGYEEKLAQAYENGCVIGIVDPDFAKVRQWASEYLSDYMAISDVDDCYIFCLSNKSGVYYSDNVHKDDGHDSDSEYLHCKYFFEPLIVWVNSQFDGTRATDEKPSADNYSYTIEHTVSFSASKSVWKCSSGSDDDIAEGNGSMSYQYKITPVYVYENQSGAGDYYDVSATYTIRSENMYRDHVRQQHGGFWTTYSALFLKHFKFSVYVKDSGGNVVPMSYVNGNEPIPESTQGTTEYTHKSGWNIGLGVTLGGSTEKGFEGHGNFSWGYSRSNEVSQSIADMSIVNCSEVNTPGWDIECMNTPHDDAQGAHDISDYCPQIARGTLIFHTHWIWYNPRTEDWSKDSLGKLCTTVSCEYDGIGTDSGVRYTRTLSEKDDTFKFSDTSDDEILIAPNRIPFGTVSITNSFSDENIKIANIEVKDKSGNIIATDTDARAHGESYQFNLPQGEYLISLDAGTSRATLKHYKYSDGSSDTYKVYRRENIDDIFKLLSDFDFVESK